jgi:predicted nucleic acid-binding protein
MAGRVLADTGPLVAALRARDRHHVWTRHQLEAIRPPLVTCEAVLSEAFFLLQAVPAAREGLAAFIDRGVVEIGFDFQDERDATLRLMHKYGDTPMSFADACLVRMSELDRTRVSSLLIAISSRIVATAGSAFRCWRPGDRRMARAHALPAALTPLTPSSPEQPTWQAWPSNATS